MYANFERPQVASGGAQQEASGALRSSTLNNLWLNASKPEPSGSSTLTTSVGAFKLGCKGLQAIEIECVRH